MGNPTVKSIKVCPGGHTHKSSWTDTEAHIKYRVVLESNGGVDRYVLGNGPEIAFQALRDYLGWTDTKACTYPNVDYLLSTDATVTQEGGVNDPEPIYIIDVTYKTQRNNWSGYDFSPYPWLQPCQITWSSRAVTEALDRDIYGRSIRNSAGEAFSPPLEKQVFHPVCTIIRNEYTLTPNVIPYNIYTYLDTINYYAITIAGADIAIGGAKITNMACTRRDYQGTPYYECTYEFEIKPDSWLTRVLDQGGNYWRWDAVSSSWVIAPFENGSGEIADIPNLLDGYGRRLIPAGTLNTEGLAYYKYFETYTLTNFADLLLPTNMNDRGF